MDNAELKEELGRITSRLDNVEGYFSNFDATLNNHMRDYLQTQTEIKDEQKTIREKVEAITVSVAKLQSSEGLAVILIKWVIAPLIILLGALVGIKLLVPGL